MSGSISSEALLEAAELYEKAAAVLQGGPMAFYLRKNAEGLEYLLKRFSPYRAGDAVELAKAPEINSERPGWRAYKHFLVEGAWGIVRRADVDAMGLSFYVVFPGLTRLKDGGEVPSENHDIPFCLREEYLRHPQGGGA